LKNAGKFLRNQQATNPGSKNKQGIFILKNAGKFQRNQRVERQKGNEV
jgi:hypothetical protein